MRIFILGCGRIGSQLANLLDHDGHEVTVMDSDPEAFRRLNRQYRGQAVVGLGIDEDALRRAGIEQVDAFLAVTDGDNTNVMAAQIAQKVFQVPRVIGQVKDPRRGEIYHQLGLTTFSPTTIGADQIREVIDEYAATLSGRGGQVSGTRRPSPAP